MGNEVVVDVLDCWGCSTSQPSHPQHCQKGCLGIQSPRWPWMVDVRQLAPEGIIQGNCWPWLVHWMNFFGLSYLAATIQGNYSRSARGDGFNKKDDFAGSIDVWCDQIWVDSMTFWGSLGQEDDYSSFVSCLAWCWVSSWGKRCNIWDCSSRPKSENLAKYLPLWKWASNIGGW